MGWQWHTKPCRRSAVHSIPPPFHFNPTTSALFHLQLLFWSPNAPCLYNQAQDLLLLTLISISAHHRGLVVATFLFLPASFSLAPASPSCVSSLMKLPVASHTTLQDAGSMCPMKDDGEWPRTSCPPCSSARAWRRRGVNDFKYAHIPHTQHTHRKLQSGLS